MVQIALARFAARPRFVVARQRQTCRHRSCRDYCLCINISLHPMVSAIAAAAHYFSHGSARVFLHSGYRALVKRCNLLRGASGRERHSNPPALCSFDFYGLKLAMKPSKFHYKTFELHSLHNKTPFRKFCLSYTMFYPWNATVLRHRFATQTFLCFARSAATG